VRVPHPRHVGIRGGIAAAVIGLPAALAVVLPGATAQHAGARPLSPWRLVFFDNFSHGLNRDRWGLYSGQPGGDPGGWWAPSHVVVRRGILTLATYRDPRFSGRWVSGGVSSAPALKQTYGKYEVRLRLDRGVGVAFVALLWPANGGWPPEIDFAEDGGETRSRDHVTATLHFGPRNSQIQRTLLGDFTRWHVLGVEWTPGRLDYTIDGRVWAVVRSRAVPSEPMELDLQAQAGTCGDQFAPCPDRSTPARVNADIDWVAAYAYRPRHG
jgi:beta-glucanase (GH16 family)